MPTKHFVSEKRQKKVIRSLIFRRVSKVNVSRCVGFLNKKMEEDDYIRTTYWIFCLKSTVVNMDGGEQLHDKFCRRMCPYWITHSWHWRTAYSNWNVCTLLKWMLVATFYILTPDSNWFVVVCCLQIIVQYPSSGNRARENIYHTLATASEQPLKKVSL